jgi:DNA invertase Pin-like site-specific DNA recombinase
MLHIYAALAEKERALISERTKAALRAAKAQGTVLGNPRLSEAAAQSLLQRAGRPQENVASDPSEKGGPDLPFSQCIIRNA